MDLVFSGSVFDIVLLLGIAPAAVELVDLARHVALLEQIIALVDFAKASSSEKIAQDVAIR